MFTKTKRWRYIFREIKQRYMFTGNKTLALYHQGNKILVLYVHKNKTLVLYFQGIKILVLYVHKNKLLALYIQRIKFVKLLLYSFVNSSNKCVDVQKVKPTLQIPKSVIKCCLHKFSIKTLPCSKSSIWFCQICFVSGYQLK